MKTYKGNEIIKAAKYLEELGSNRAAIEQEFTLESVDVGDREATIHYVGKVDGFDAKLDVKVYKAKTYANEYTVHINGQYFSEKDYNKVTLWMHSITKLDTDDAKSGKIQLLPAEWKKVHKDFLAKFVKDFHVKKKNYLECYVSFPYLGNGSFNDIGDEFGLVLLEYDPKLKDFKKDFNDYQFHLQIGISNDTTTLALGYYVHSYEKNLNHALEAILPNAKHGKTPILQFSGDRNLFRYVEGTYDEILEICNGLKEKLFAHYDQIIKNCGGNPNWRQATTWSESGPCYPAGSEESKKAREQLDAKVDGLNKEAIERVAGVVKSVFNVDIKTVFENSTVECRGYRFADTVVIKFPYKFPKVKGSKVVMQDKEMEVEIYRDDYPSPWDDGRYHEVTVSYRLPAIYATMGGEYTDFEEARHTDSGKMMMLKSTRKMAKVWYSGRYSYNSPEPVFDTIKKQIADLEAFIKYKGFSV